MNGKNLEQSVEHGEGLEPGRSSAATSPAVVVGLHRALRNSFRGAVTLLVFAAMVDTRAWVPSWRQAGSGNQLDRHEDGVDPRRGLHHGLERSVPV